MPLRLNDGFIEAIRWARTRVPVLPEVFYGELPAEIRSRAFTVSGLAAIDQIERVRNSLARAIDRGESFQKWKDSVTRDLFSLPDWHKELIFRANVQTAYQAGHWQGQLQAADRRPFLMYDAVNDSRTRPNHRKLDGFIAPIDDPVWDRIYPPGGFNCRCGTVQISAAQAKSRGWKGETPPVPADPDPGWGYHPAKQNEAIKAAMARRLQRCSETTDLAAGASRPCFWLKGEGEAYIRSLREHLEPLQLLDELRRLLPEKQFAKYEKKAKRPAEGLDLALEEGIAIVAYTDREIGAVINGLARAMTDHGGILPADMELGGLLIIALDDALAKLPPKPGIYWRGDNVAGMPDELRQRWIDAHRKGRVVQYFGFTSVSGVEGRQFGGDWQMYVDSETARDISMFSLPGDPESLIPRKAYFLYDGIYSGYRILREHGSMEGAVKKNRQFKAKKEESFEEHVARLVRAGFSPERARQSIIDVKAAIDRANTWPMAPKEERERILQRFTDLQFAGQPGYERNELLGFHEDNGGNGKK